MLPLASRGVKAGKRLRVCWQKSVLLFLTTFTEPNLTCEEDEVMKAGGSQNLCVSNPQV